MQEDNISWCPFQPTQPVDLKFFVGRRQLIQSIQQIAELTFYERAAAIYLCGAGRIGKTSLANYLKVALEAKYQAFGFHVLLGGNQGPTNSEEFFTRIVTSMIQEKSSEPSIMAHVQKIFKHVILEVNVGVVTLKSKELQASLPRNASEFVSFLRTFGEKLHSGTNKGFVLVLDDIDGIATQPFFASFLKEVFDASALARKKVPFILLLCGTMESFKAIRANNVRCVDFLRLHLLEPLTPPEMTKFFQSAFRSAGQDVTAEAMATLIEFSNGMPQLMHLVGEATFLFSQRDRAISGEDACRGVAVAAEDYGRKFVNRRIQGLLDNVDYATLFEHLFGPNTILTFSRKDLITNVGKDRIKYVNALLRKLSAIKVIEKGDGPGEWKFIDPMISVYLHMLKMKRECRIG